MSQKTAPLRPPYDGTNYEKERSKKRNLSPPETEEKIFQRGINEGINFEKYDHIPVEITGTNAL